MTIQVARRLGLTVVAEGVEHHSIIELLRPSSRISMSRRWSDLLRR